MHIKISKEKSFSTTTYLINFIKYGLGRVSVHGPYSYSEVEKLLFIKKIFQFLRKLRDYSFLSFLVENQFCQNKKRFFFFSNYFRDHLDERNGLQGPISIQVSLSHTQTKPKSNLAVQWRLAVEIRTQKFLRLAC